MSNILPSVSDATGGDEITNAAEAVAIKTSSGLSGTSSSSSSLWKIVRSGKDGDKYLTFSGPPLMQQQSTRSRRQYVESDNPNSNINDDGMDDESIKIRVYKMRWYILACICFAQIANSINWICYSPIADFTAQFYSASYDSVNYLSLSYLIITIPASLFSFWIADNFGIRLSINVGVWFNLIGSVIKALSSLDSANGEPLVKQVDFL